MHQQQTGFENIVGKEEIAHNEQFLLFPQCFLLPQKIVSPSVNILDIISLFAANWKSPNWHARLIVNPLPDDKCLDWSKLKQIADNILKCI